MSNVKVEALEDGRIVSVSEDYALREGLPILRKVSDRKSFESERISSSPVQRVSQRVDKKAVSSRVPKIDEFRRTLELRRNLVNQDLKPNFHWDISRKRRERGFSRKKFSELLGVDEETIKLLENGLLPKDNFILVNRVQEILGINLRLKQDSFQPMRELVDKPSEKKSDDFSKFRKEKKEEFSGSLFGDDIELVEE